MSSDLGQQQKEHLEILNKREALLGTRYQGIEESRVEERGSPKKN